MSRGEQMHPNDPKTEVAKTRLMPDFALEAVPKNHRSWRIRPKMWSFDNLKATKEKKTAPALPYHESLWNTTGRWWQLNFDEHIFQMGWNHQLE